MSRHTAYSDFEVKIGKRTASWGEVRITYTIAAGRPARTWANASDGNYYPEEGPDVQVEKVEYRFGSSDLAPWVTDESDLFDDIDTDWLLEQAAEDAA